jgi:hypothetical protein
MSRTDLLLFQEEVHGPAAAHVLAAAPAMAKDVGVGAAGVFEGVGGMRRGELLNQFRRKTVSEYRRGYIVILAEILAVCKQEIGS